MAKKIEFVRTSSAYASCVACHGRHSVYDVFVPNNMVITVCEDCIQKFVEGWGKYNADRED